uniref:Uncharacterized protein n=1 Tax=Leersia perrieri TaxID=77586 RepID=A0A0D9VTV8_9ORYZ
MLQQANFPQTPQYNIFVDQYSASQTSYRAELLIQGRNENEGDITVYGDGWSAISALDEAAYLAMGYLRHTLPELAEHFLHYPSHGQNGGAATFPGLVMPPDRYIRALYAELERARQRIATLDSAVEPHANFGFYTGEIVYGPNVTLAPGDYLPHPAGYYDRVVRRHRRMSMGFRRNYREVPDPILYNPTAAFGPESCVFHDGRAYRLVMTAPSSAPPTAGPSIPSSSTGNV